MNRKTKERLIAAYNIALALFGLFIIYQLLRKIFGGSWAIEEVMLAILMVIVGFCFTLIVVVVQLKSDHKHLHNQFGSLATDFKAVRNDVEVVKNDLEILKNDVGILKKAFKRHMHKSA